MPPPLLEPIAAQLVSGLVLGPVGAGVALVLRYGPRLRRMRPPGGSARADAGPATATTRGS